MGQLIDGLRTLISKISITYLIFILFTLIGCLYQVTQVIKVYLKFETKVDVSFYYTSEYAVPVISLCNSADALKKNISLKIDQMSPDQIYNNTYDFGDVILEMRYSVQNGGFVIIQNVSSFREDIFNGRRNKTKHDIQFEKTITYHDDYNLVCYNLIHPEMTLERKINQYYCSFDLNLHGGTLYMHLLPRNHSIYDLTSNNFIAVDGINVLIIFL